MEKMSKKLLQLLYPIQMENLIRLGLIPEADAYWVNIKENIELVGYDVFIYPTRK